MLKKQFNLTLNCVATTQCPQTPLFHLKQDEEPQVRVGQKWPIDLSAESKRQNQDEQGRQGSQQSFGETQTTYLKGKGSGYF